MAFSRQYVSGLLDKPEFIVIGSSLYDRCIVVSREFGCVENVSRRIKSRDVGEKFMALADRHLKQFVSDATTKIFRSSYLSKCLRTEVYSLACKGRCRCQKGGALIILS